MIEVVAVDVSSHLFGRRFNKYYIPVTDNGRLLPLNYVREYLYMLGEYAKENLDQEFDLGDVYCNKNQYKKCEIKKLLIDFPANVHIKE